MASSPLPPDFNPHTQPITIFYPDGTNFSLSLLDITNETHKSLDMCIIFAAQLGAALILLILLAVLTKPEKRRTALFSLNLLCLGLLIIRSVFQMQYYLGPWADTYRYYSYDNSDIPASAIRNTIAGTAVQLLLEICLEISLIMQVRVVYAAEPRLNLAMTVASVTIALLVIAFFILAEVQQTIATIQGATYLGGWVYPTARGLFAFSTCFFSLIFIVKLGLAIRRRKRLGLEQFGPLQVIFIMGCQTMVVPAIFSILENVVDPDGLASLTAAFVAISLPLSTMWASAKTDAPQVSSMGRSYQNVFGSGSSASKSKPSVATNSVTMENSHGSSRFRSRMPRNRADWEVEDDDENALGVTVEKSFDVENSPASGSSSKPLF